MKAILTFEIDDAIMEREGVTPAQMEEMMGAMVAELGVAPPGTRVSLEIKPSQLTETHDDGH